MSHALMLKIVTSVTKSVKAIVQVMGPQKSPSFPSDIEDARNWYERVCGPVLNRLGKSLISFQCSLVVIPSTHPMTGPVMKPKDIRRHGTIISIGTVSSIQRLIEPNFQSRCNTSDPCNLSWSTRNQTICEGKAIHFSVVEQDE